MRIEIEITPEPPGPLLPAAICNEVGTRLLAGEERGTFPWHMSNPAPEGQTREIIKYEIKWGVLA